MAKIGYLPRRILRKAIAGIVVIVILLIAGDKAVKFVSEKIYPQKYSKYVTLYADMYGVDQALCYAMIKCESGFNASAQSTQGAKGLMQLTDDTYNFLSIKIHGKPRKKSNVFLPKENIQCGIYYLSYLKSLFGNEECVIAAYNAGPENVKNWLKDEKYSDDGKYLKSLPYKETESHIKKVQSVKNIYKKLYYNKEK